MKGKVVRRRRGDEGAALVEFAIITPVLFLLIFGVIEFGWGFAQYLDARHGAREASRLAAVNYSDPDNPVPSTGATQTGEIIQEACDRMGGDVNGATVIVRLDDPNDDTDTANPPNSGERAWIEVEAELDTLTGFLDFALDDITIKDTISFRLERDVDWSPTVGPVTCV